MSFKRNIKGKILDKSDSYIFYRNGYHEYKFIHENFIETQCIKSNNKVMKNDKLFSQVKELSIKQKKLDNQVNILKKSLNEKNKDFMELKKEYDDMLQSNNNYLDKISVLSKNQENLNNEVSKLQSELFEKNNFIEELINGISIFSYPFDDFEDYLIKSPIFPFVQCPLSEKLQRYFLLMDEFKFNLVDDASKIIDKPLISVIMPIMDDFDFLNASINSILSQNYENYELIIVIKDNNEDALNLLKNFDNGKVHTVFVHESKNISSMRNIGFEESSGEYIIHLSQNCCLDSEYFNTIIDLFFKLPDADCIYCAQSLYNKLNSDLFAIQFGSYNKSLIHNYNYIPIDGFVHKKRVYDEIGGFDQSLSEGECWDFILKLSNYYNIYSFPIMLSHNYVDINSILNNFSQKSIDRIRLKNEILPICKSILSKKINIIIPFYNSFENIKNCINSILDNYSDVIKIIIINNTENRLLNDYFDSYKNVIIVNNVEDSNFLFTINKGLDISDSDADLLFLSEEAVITYGSLESLQKNAYELPDCGIVVSQQLIKNHKSLQDFDYVCDDYWIDLISLDYYENIKSIPLFNNGDFIELKWAPFFCTYIKREVFYSSCGFNCNSSKYYEIFRIFSEYITQVLGLKIYYISDSIVFDYVCEKYDDNVYNKPNFIINRFNVEIINKKFREYIDFKSF